MSTSKMGRYELIGPLGRGGMAEVWRARMRGAASFSRDVALKIMLPDVASDPGFVTMFVDEAVISAKLKHPNIVDTLDFGRVGGRYFIALELIDGVPLRALLGARKRDPLSVEQSVYIVAQLAAALDYAYEARGEDGRALRLVHRDVNPANVMVTSHGLVKLNDFGIAKAVGAGALTEAGQLKGKLSYMSPEQAWARPVDGRSDIYALGLVLFEMLSGRRAISGASDIEVLEAARNGVQPVFDAHLPPALVEIMRTALAADPDQRHPNAGVLRDALSRQLEGVSIPRLQEKLGELVAQEMIAQRAAAPQASSFQPITDDALPSTDGHEVVEGTEVATGANLRGPPAQGSRPSSLTDAVEASPRSISAWWAMTVLPLAIAGGWWVRQRQQVGPNAAPTVLARSDAATPMRGSAATPELPSTPATPATPATASATAMPSGTPSPTAHPTVSAEHHAKGPATLRIQARPWAQVWVDGKDVGMTPLRPIELAPGRHEITGENPALGKRRLVVSLSAGERKNVELQFDKGKP